ncbi:hypothetical protein QUF56_13690 [Ureibacillus composti]|nr:hypothetical protein [Ureibacillus composti]
MKYKIVNKLVFEQAQVRSVADVQFNEEQLENGMKIVVSKADPTLALYLVEVDGQKKFEVRWDDSIEVFIGWFSAWENFTWCLSIADQEKEQEVNQQ